jgi:hypothetical protein
VPFCDAAERQVLEKDKGQRLCVKLVTRSDFLDAHDRRLVPFIWNHYADTETSFWNLYALFATSGWCQAACGLFKPET